MRDVRFGLRQLHCWRACVPRHRRIHHGSTTVRGRHERGLPPVLAAGDALAKQLLACGAASWHSCAGAVEHQCVVLTAGQHVAGRGGARHTGLQLVERGAAWSCVFWARHHVSAGRAYPGCVFPDVMVTCGYAGHTDRGVV